MQLELNQEETKVLVELLTIAGYITTQVSDNVLPKALEMHDVIQKIYRAAEKSDMPDGFNEDTESNMLFPKHDIISENPDCPMQILKSYNEFAAADVLSQQLALRDAMRAKGLAMDARLDQLDDAFFEKFAAAQKDYLEEFARNGFQNIQVTRIQLS